MYISGKPEVLDFPDVPFIMRYCELVLTGMGSSQPTPGMVVTNTSNDDERRFSMRCPAWSRRALDGFPGAIPPSNCKLSLL